MFTQKLYKNLSEIKGFNDLVYKDKDENETTNILKLNKIECRTENNQKYKVIRYDKNVLNNDLIPTYGYCRSIVVNSDNHVVSFAPPKSIPMDVFISLYPNKNENILAMEFVDGTMINVFWDSKIGLTGAWEITTRNTVGATSNFFKSETSKTFRTMFLEAAVLNGLVLENLDRRYCYSFVLQHPENRIVVSFSQPQLYLVAVYHIVNQFENIQV